MAICPRCKHENREGELLCGSCGFALVAPLSTKKLDTASVDVLVLPATGDTRLLDKMRLHFDLSNGKSLDAAFSESSDTLILGLLVPGTNGKPDIDFTSVEGLQLGVSRFHAVLHRVGQNVSIADTNSTNGTWVNGKRLVGNEPLFLHSGDEIFLGWLKMSVYFTR